MPYPSITTDQYERLRDEIRGLRDETESSGSESI